MAAARTPANTTAQTAADATAGRAALPADAAAPPAFGTAPALGREIHGRARLGKRTKDLVRRLCDADIAVIDHCDLDRVAAEDLVEAGVRAVINVSPSTSERYPNPGPLILVRAGVPLVDAVGASLFDDLSDGDRIALRGGTIMAGDGSVLAVGTLRTLDELTSVSRVQQSQIGEAIEQFAENTLAHIRDERELLAGRLSIPELETDFRDRHVLIVVRGTDYKRDLRALRPYIREVRPLLVGVDGGGDALLESGLRPDLIVGDMDSASDRVLECGAELIVHAYRDGRAPGAERLERMGVEHKVLPAPGTSQDVAMLIAHERGARLIVSVGSHLNLIEFLDKARAGMSSTFLTRLRVGEILVDAKGVSRLYRPAPSRRLVIPLVAAFGAVMVAVGFSSPQLHRLIDLVWLKIQVLLGG
ncbi:MAG: putative cytokinetic ring protein SteA [Solirubrobacterales bacterium]